MGSGGVNVMNKLSSQKCLPCEGNIPPLTPPEIAILLKQLNGWQALKPNNTKIEKDYQFQNFQEALVFVNKVGIIAEQEGHHPDILLHDWNKVKITLWTHTIKGLSNNDFILAAKIDEIIWK